ncbi:unnamed protein product [Rhizoctonia solani]|uniref:Fungal-type protein kinase domain-containing protein n=1 Tax=Rhizoctonia solani TaxID=456999 RepID=A0A8H3ASF2_9AGAM|nr:unnamed protein product [Rhizoctonia solani]
MADEPILLSSGKRPVVDLIAQTTQRQEKLRYDIGTPLEGLLGIINKQYNGMYIGSLHQDISDRSIMFAPHSDGYQQRGAGGYTGVNFVNQVLAKDKECDPRSECLVIGLLENGEHGGQQAGFSKFVARSISAGELLDEEHYHSREVDIPSMEGTLDDYGRFMDTTEFQVLNNSDSTSHFEVQFEHRLFHDVESTIWVIAWALARSISEGATEEEEPHRNFCELFHVMHRHFPDPREDRRATTFLSSTKYWRSVLHPDLADLGPMLQKMFVYIWPEWAYRTELNPEHVHEALMRLLLAEMLRIDTGGRDINIVIGGQKIPPPPISFLLMPSSTLSKTTSDLEGTGMSGTESTSARSSSTGSRHDTAESQPPDVSH